MYLLNDGTEPSHCDDIKKYLVILHAGEDFNLMTSAEQEVLFSKLESKLDALSQKLAENGFEDKLQHVLEDCEIEPPLLCLGVIKACFNEHELTKLRQQPLNCRLGHLAPATDGATSDVYSEEEEQYRWHRVSFAEIKNLLVDESTIHEIPDLPEQIMGHIMVLHDIIEEANYHQLEYFMNYLKIPPDILKMQFIFYRQKYSLAIQFKRQDQALRFYHSCKDKIPNFKSTFGINYRVFWAKVVNDTLEMAEAAKREIDLPFKLFNSQFCGVIVRNIPPFTSVEEIAALFTQFQLNPRIEAIEEFRSECFCLVHLPTIEECEVAAWVLGRHQIRNDFYLKTRIHPQSNFRRTTQTRCRPIRELWSDIADPHQTNLPVKVFSEDIQKMKLNQELVRAEAEKQRQLEYLSRSRFEYAARYGLEQSPHKNYAFYNPYHGDWRQYLNTTPEKERTAGFGYNINTSNQVQMLSRQTSEDSLTRFGGGGAHYPQPYRTNSFAQAVSQVYKEDTPNRILLRRVQYSADQGAPAQAEYSREGMIAGPRYQYPPPGLSALSRSASKTPEDQESAQPKQVISATGVYSQMSFLQAKPHPRQGYNHIFEQERIIANSAHSKSNQIDVFSSDPEDSEENDESDQNESSNRSEEKNQFSDESESIDELDLTQYRSAARKPHATQPASQKKRNIDGELMAIMLQKRKPAVPDQRNSSSRLASLAVKIAKK